MRIIITDAPPARTSISGFFAAHEKAMSPRRAVKLQNHKAQDIKEQSRAFQPRHHREYGRMTAPRRVTSPQPINNVPRRQITERSNRANEKRYSFVLNIIHVSRNELPNKATRQQIRKLQANTACIRIRRLCQPKESLGVTPAVG